jgi:hypothetical protein
MMVLSILMLDRIVAWDLAWLFQTTRSELIARGGGIGHYYRATEDSKILMNRPY